MDGRKAEGYLIKSNTSGKSWKRRWFVLTLSSLEYYKNNTKRKKKGEFPLLGAAVGQEPHDKAPTPFVLQLETEGRVTHLCADSAEIRDEWYRVLVAQTEEELLWDLQAPPLQ